MEYPVSYSHKQRILRLKYDNYLQRKDQEAITTNLLMFREICNILECFAVFIF